MLIYALLGGITCFSVGALVGMILSSKKLEIITQEVFQEVKQKLEGGKAQFIEPVSFKEKFNKAKDIDDLIKNG